MPFWPGRVGIRCNHLRILVSLQSVFSIFTLFLALFWFPLEKYQHALQLTLSVYHFMQGWKCWDAPLNHALFCFLPWVYKVMLSLADCLYKQLWKNGLFLRGHWARYCNRMPPLQQVVLCNSIPYIYSLIWPNSTKIRLGDLHVTHHVILNHLVPKIVLI